MSNSPYKGGKGQVAPYITTHCRVPEPIKPLIDSIINDWKHTIHSGSDFQGKMLIERLQQALVPDLLAYLEKPLTQDEAIAIANMILQENAKSKRSVKVVVAKLLTAIYKTEIKLQ
jgi:hypothetical protein